MNPKESLLFEMKAHGAFPALMKDINNSTPLAAPWKPDENNVEEMKYQSALREGYFLALSHFKISENKNE